jgi:hypothetical protein
MHLIVAAVSCGHGPLKVLLAPLFAAFDALLGIVGGDVRPCFPVTARGRVPTSLGRAKHDRLVAGGSLGGDAMRLLECVAEEVTLSALSQVLIALLPWRGLE